MVTGGYEWVLVVMGGYGWSWGNEWLRVVRGGSVLVTGCYRWLRVVLVVPGGYGWLWGGNRWLRVDMGIYGWFWLFMIC